MHLKHFFVQYFECGTPYVWRRGLLPPPATSRKRAQRGRGTTLLVQGADSDMTWRLPRRFVLILPMLSHTRGAKEASTLLDRAPQYWDRNGGCEAHCQREDQCNRRECHGCMLCQKIPNFKKLSLPCNGQGAPHFKFCTP
eukprot:6965776-Prymnesium_polylepis.1